MAIRKKPIFAVSMSQHEPNPTIYSQKAQYRKRENLTKERKKKTSIEHITATYRTKPMPTIPLPLPFLTPIHKSKIYHIPHPLLPSLLVRLIKTEEGQ
jgi:hypothetical protein